MVTLAILFGLSMDYQVFLVSRMNEEWVHGRPNPVAVRTGQVETARVITAAATIMICVFLTFSFMGSRDVAEFGIGLAAAVALDAFILRTVLVPAAMHLFGNTNWWLPRWLDRRLLHLAIEPQSPRQPHPPQSPPSVKPAAGRAPSSGCGSYPAFLSERTWFPPWPMCLRAWPRALPGRATRVPLAYSQCGRELERDRRARWRPRC